VFQAPKRWRIALTVRKEEAPFYGWRVGLQVAKQFDVYRRCVDSQFSLRFPRCNTVVPKMRVNYPQG